MRKINYKKLLNIFLWVFGLAGLLISWSFAAKKQKGAKIKSLNIQITNDNENPFISDKDVEYFFTERNDALNNTEAGKINIHTLENALNSHPAVENSEISYSLNGELKISVKQRRPLVRIINISGESYYIDSLSLLMPLSHKYSARVLVASGFINEPFSKHYSVSVEELAKNELLSNNSMLDEIYYIAKSIYAHPVLSDLIHQVYLNEEKDFILYPVIGNQSIIIGKAEHVEEKLNKLEEFYKEGMNKTDSWNKYTSINLKYKNLVVCTKK